jgi:arsenate reductase/ArsR family transcriptional regulator
MTRLGESVTLHKALGHPARQRILALLQDGELCVCQLTAALGLATSTVSAHLGELKRAGLVNERKEGRWVSYAWSSAPVAGKLVREVVGRIAEDPQVGLDAQLARQLRKVPVEELCRVDRDLSRLGIRWPGAATRPGKAPSRVGLR